MDLKYSMNLAGESLNNCLCPEQYDLPYFRVIIDEKNKGFVHFFMPDHNLGRWWDAMLRLEHTTGFVIPPDVEIKMFKNLHMFFDNPENLCFIPFGLEGVETQFYPHSFRENILALSALTYYRGNSWAKHKIDKMLDTISKILRPDCSWDFDMLDYHNKIVEAHGDIDHTEYRGEKYFIQDPNVGVDGRFIEGLAICYSLTGNERAFQLLNKLANFHFEHSLSDDGSINKEFRPNHTHSYLGMVRGLLLYGVMFKQKKYIDKIEITYRNAIKHQVIKETGFASHDFLFDGISETASAADVAQIALLLARNGYPEYYDDVERLIRSRIIPSQITENLNLKPSIDNPGSNYDDLNKKVIGGYGCGIDHPNRGNFVYTDITAHVIHSMIDIYEHIIIKQKDFIEVCLHFDYEDDDIKIVSKREKDATVKITPKVPNNIMIRVPGWVPVESVSVTVNGQPVKPIKIGNFLHISKDMDAKEILLKYSLPIRESKETTTGIEFTYKWKGDEIIGVSPNVEYCPFYPSIDD